MAAQALRGNGESGPFAIHDLYFFRPLEVDDEQSREVRVTLERSEEGYALAVRSEVRFDGRTAFQLNAQATLVPGALPEAAAVDIGAIATRCQQHRAADPTGLRSPQEEHLRFGPRWRVLQSVAYGAGEGIAALQLPAPFHDDLAAGYVLHPALLDLATGWAMRLIAGYAPDHLWVPVSYREVRVHRPLPAQHDRQTLVTSGIEDAVAVAREQAGDKDVALMGGGVVTAALAAGLMDEVLLHQVPVLLGGGRRFFDELPDHVALRLIEAVPAPGVTHLHYEVLR